MELTPRENALIAYRHGVPEWVPFSFADFNSIQALPEMERYIGTTQGKDYFGVEWTFVPGIGAPMPTPGKILLENISEWRDVVHIPDVEAIDWEKQADIDLHMDARAILAGKGVVRRADGLSNLAEGKLPYCMVINGMFERLHACMGMQNALCALMTEPDECKAFFHAIADYKIAYFNKIAKYYPVDVINAHDDYGTGDRLFMRPELWRELIKPELKRIVDSVHANGLIYQHHSCGYVEPLIEDFIEIGIDAVDTWQGASNPNVKELKQKYGSQITFCGGFDNVHILDREGTTEDEMRAEYIRVINDLAPGGSYIAFPISAMPRYAMVFLQMHQSYGLHFYENLKKQQKQ